MNDILKELEIFFKYNVEGLVDLNAIIDDGNESDDNDTIMTNDHSKLKNLDYNSSGHTGFASQEELKNYVKAEELAKVARTGKHDDLKGNPEALTNLEIENILK